jgi:hypothetical protein
MSEIAADILHRARRIADLLHRIEAGENIVILCRHRDWVLYQTALIRQAAARLTDD